MDFNTDNFIYRLSVLLDENNMTQTDLANKIGVSNVTICRYLTGERIPRLDVVAKVAHEFNVSLDFLLGLSEDKDIKDSDISLDLNIAIPIEKLYSLDNRCHLSKAQIELLKKILLANKDFILSA